MKTQFTKDVSVERVTPPALLDYCKAVGQSKKVERTEFAQEFDSSEKAKWRTGLFVRYAHRLAEHSEAVFADERLFYAPIPLPLKMWEKRGLSYTPTELVITLGHIIVWWQEYRCAQVEDESGEHHYIYGFDITQGKFGFPTKPYIVRYIGVEGEGFCVEIDRSLPELSNSLYEVCKRYPYSSLARKSFDLEDAIEVILGERVYERL